MLEVFKLCNYKAPPELFSMYGCLFGDANLVVHLQRLPADWLSANFDTLLRVPPSSLQPPPAPSVSPYSRDTLRCIDHT